MQKYLLWTAVALLASANLRPATAGIIPYNNTGHVNTATYTFTATATGDVIAYFAGSGAAFDEQLAMSVNGGPLGAFGLDNHSSIVGNSLNLGSVNAGDTLVFAVHVFDTIFNHVDLGNVYSDPSLNGPYDSGVGVQHIYSTDYDGVSPPFGGAIPPGTYVAFEDLPVSYGPDYNYFDETFVFTNVSTVISNSTAVPEPASLTVWGLGLVCLGAFGRMKRRKEEAASV